MAVKFIATISQPDFLFFPPCGKGEVGLNFCSIRMIVLRVNCLCVRVPCVKFFRLALKNVMELTMLPTMRCSS